MHTAHPDGQKAIVERIHGSEFLVELVISGGGSKLVPWLLAVPGASRTLLCATVPYHQDALRDYLGREPSQYCSAETARALAMAAYMRALASFPAAAPLIGLSCTASLASDRAKTGDHRIHIAAHTARRTSCLSVILEKGAREREEEETVAAALALECLARACGVDEAVMTGLSSVETAMHESATATDAIAELAAGKRRSIAFGSADAGPTLLFPGAFNPLHEGHRGMAAWAANRTGQPVVLEISIENVDKPPLDFLEIERRLDGNGDLPVVLTRAATFVEKAELFPRCTFIVGIDTLKRIGDPAYYGGSRKAVRRAIRAIAGSGCTFLVFGRVQRDGFEGLEHANVPPELADICEGVPEADFRVDLSSTAIREATASDPAKHQGEEEESSGPVMQRPMAPR